MPPPIRGGGIKMLDDGIDFSQFLIVWAIGHMLVAVYPYVHYNLGLGVF